VTVTGAVTDSAVEIVRGFRGQRVLVIGDVMLDSYLEGTAARLCSEGPVPVVRKTGEQRLPGGAANTAANLTSLGADVLLLGVVGNDPAGGLLRATLRAQQIDDRWLVEDEAAETLHKLRVLADGQYVVRFDEGGVRGPRSPRAERRLLATVGRVFPRCDLVVVSDYGYGAASDAMIARLRELRELRAAECPLLVDSKELQRFRLAGATVVTPNHLEAQLAAAERSGDRHAPPLRADVRLPHMEEVGRRLLAQLDCTHVAITLGAQGVLLMDRDTPPLHVPAHPATHANDVGAGDSFAAAMALALGSGADAAMAARLGVDAAGIAVTKRWTAVVSHHELLRRASLRDHSAGHRAPASPDARDDDAGETMEGAIARLAERLAGARAAGRTIVFTNGVFDILNAGHVGFLRQARALGDVLVVGVNTDRGAACLKGQAAPLNDQRDRLALIAALDPVDHAVLFDDATPAETIRALHPHIHVKGGEYADEALPEAEAVRAVGGCIVILPLASGQPSVDSDRLSAIGRQAVADTLDTTVLPLTTGELDGPLLPVGGRLKADG